MYPFAAMTAQKVEPALRELLELCRRREGRPAGIHALFEATCSIGGDNDTSYVRVSVERLPRDWVKIYVYAWNVGHDLARYVGGNPPPSWNDELLRLRGPVSPHQSNSSWRVAEALCALVGGTNVARPEDGLASFSLALNSAVAPKPPGEQSSNAPLDPPK
ncbi:hypothetical protein OG788_39170 [Streptomyces sp. NBC_00647]|uniref:hypothetical protein n=1 Tax=Streptomyces sp. NBC_00647 TaxID=2975796 RepID=UPI0032491A2C